MPKDKLFEFKAAMTELEKIVTSLEGESESLEKSLALFESGMKLTESLRSHLEQAEQRIRILTADAKGQIKSDESET
jgi:exodeoxyribonuclease VII small subunit|tara:strand:- start:329 stop:559 length:231 start_codon:yes stop_codon:yes gene_type:complete